MNVQTRIETPRGLSIETFLDWCERREERYELVEGTPFVQPWVKRNHSRIASNVSFLLQTVLDRDLYDLHQGDFAISTGPTTIRYADVLMEPSGASGLERTAEDAVLIVEILSPSTAEQDFGPKRDEYFGLPSLKAYIVLAQDERCAWIWTRQTDGTWLADPNVVRTGVLALAELATDLSLSEIYRGVSAG